MTEKYAQIPTPAYVLEIEKLERNLQIIQQVSTKAGVEIILALKGFSMWSVFDKLKQFGVKTATASSLNEAKLTNEYFGSKAHTYSPVYIPSEFEDTLKASSHLTFNSLSQFEHFEHAIQKLDTNCSIGLRVNPEYSVVETPLYDPTTPGTRLGVEATLLQNGLPKGIDGLHFHNLCESDASDLKKTLEKVEELYGHLLPELKWINVGGGHLMTRKGYNLELLIETLQAFKAKYKLDIFMEPGSAFAWDCGPIVASVLDIIESGGIKTAMLDVSFTAHMPDTLEMPYRPNILEASKMPNQQNAFRLGGVSCLAGDYLDTYYFEKPLQIGDKIVLDDMIHYTMVKTTMFNGVKHPDIGILQKDGSYNIVRTFTYEDYKSRLS